MGNLVSADVVRDAYGRRAEEYADLARTPEWMHELDRHTDPADVPHVLGEFARCLGDGGSLLLAMFEGTQVEPFPHAVTTAYFWPVEQMSQRLVDAGFQVVHTGSRVDPGRRPHAAIVARRSRA